MYSYTARWIRAVDGDTVRLDLDLGFGVWRRDQPYRLLRIDSSEMNTSEGRAAKAWLEGRVLAAKSLLVTTAKSDSFGRFLAELYADGVNLNDEMVTAGHAIYRTF